MGYLTESALMRTRGDIDQKSVSGNSLYNQKKYGIMQINQII